MAVTINGSTGIEYDDNVKHVLGTGDDLEIYHDGSNSYINDTGTGLLIIKSNQLQIKNDAADEKMIVADANGAVELYHNNVKKFETTADGVTVSAAEIKIQNTAAAAATVQVIGGEGSDANIEMLADEGDDAGDKWKMVANAGASDWRLYNYADGGWEKNILAGGDGGVNLYHQDTVRLQTYNAGLWLYGDMLPGENSSDLGSGSSKWQDIHATNGTIQTSDKNEKNTIVDSDLGLSFVNKLKPVSYKFNTGTRTHYGLIAQDIETTLSDISKPTSGFAGFIKEDTKDILYEKQDEIPSGKNVGDVKIAARTTYGLRYSEFIAPLIKSIQELSAEVETLKTKVAALESE